MAGSTRQAPIRSGTAVKRSKRNTRVSCVYSGHSEVFSLFQEQLRTLAASDGHGTGARQPGLTESHMIRLTAVLGRPALLAALAFTAVPLQATTYTLEP